MRESDPLNWRRRSEMASSQSTFYGILAVIAVAGLGLIGYVTLREKPSSAASFGDTAISDINETELVSEEVGVSRGSPDAPVLIEEYADYQCPYCGMVATLTIPQIMENYVDTGKARFVFYDFPLNPGASQLGAEAARCAGEQDAFWAMQKVLFTRMREWGEDRDMKGKFRQYADGLGIDGKALLDCVDAQQYREVVLRSQLRARQLGIGSTPTFIINGRRVAGAMGYDQMAEMIDQELAAQ